MAKKTSNKKTATKSATKQAYCFTTVNKTPKVVKTLTAEGAAKFAKENGFGNRYYPVDTK